MSTNQTKLIERYDLATLLWVHASPDRRSGTTKRRTQ